MTLDELNTLDNDAASAWFEQCCAANAWIEKMVSTRPYSSIDALEASAKQAWQSCTNDDYLEAFKAHPMIGDVDSLRKKLCQYQSHCSG
ncbi:hypothetical protein KUL42_25160 [Alteromonas sp. KUL42]|nr:hypothetical protein KUL42_25160 [Alteromonas sp. KUL42]